MSFQTQTMEQGQYRASGIRQEESFQTQRRGLLRMSHASSRILDMWHDDKMNDGRDSDAFLLDDCTHGLDSVTSQHVCWDKYLPMGTNHDAHSYKAASCNSQDDT